MTATPHISGMNNDATFVYFIGINKMPILLHNVSISLTHYFVYCAIFFNKLYFCNIIMIFLIDNASLALKKNYSICFVENQNFSLQIKEMHKIKTQFSNDEL